MKAQFAPEQLAIIVLAIMVLAVAFSLLTKSGKESINPYSAALLESCLRAKAKDPYCETFDWKNANTEINVEYKMRNLEELCKLNKYVNDKGEADMEECKKACKCLKK